jgi:hypothetical protein
MWLILFSVSSVTMSYIHLIRPIVAVYRWLLAWDFILITDLLKLMPVGYEKGNLPAESVAVNGRTWEREEFDTDSYQWIRPM